MSIAFRTLFSSLILIIPSPGGIGRSTAQFLLDHGARHVALLSRSGDKAEATKIALRKLREGGANVRAYACDITSSTGLKHTLETMAESMPKVKGVIQGAMVLKVCNIFHNH